MPTLSCESSSEQFFEVDVLLEVGALEYLYEVVAVLEGENLHHLGLAPLKQVADIEDAVAVAVLRYPDGIFPGLEIGTVEFPVGIYRNVWLIFSSRSSTI